MSEWAAKRFWTKAEAVETYGGFAVELDGRPVKTPAKTALIVPTRAMSEAVVEEWQAQAEKIDPLSMPVTRSANAAIDKVRTQKDEVIEMLAAYGDSDLICYRADSPVELVARQKVGWDPLVQFARASLDVALELRTGVMHVPQPADTLVRLRDHTAKLDEFQLAAFHDLVSLSGSLIICFATIQGAWSPQELWHSSRIDEEWQIHCWGEDDEAAAQARIKQAAFLHAARFYGLCVR